MSGDFLDLVPHAVICAGAIFLMLFGDQISAKRRNRRRQP